MQRESPPVLVLGSARSGTTWVGTTLGRAPGTTYVHEPDDPASRAAALGAFAGTGRHGVTEWPTELTAPAATIFDAAFGVSCQRHPRVRQRITGRLMAGATHEQIQQVLGPGAPRWSLRLRLAARLASPSCDSEHSGIRVVKSVRSIGYARSLIERYQPRVVVTRRDPLEIVGSRLALRFVPSYASLGAHVWGVAVPEDARVAALDGSPAERTAFLVAVQTVALERLVNADPAIVIADHGRLCASPESEFQEVMGRIGLEWSDEVAEFVGRSNREGSGHEVSRTASAELGKWRRTLSDSERAAAERVIRMFRGGAHSAWL